MITLGCDRTKGPSGPRPRPTTKGAAPTGVGPRPTNAGGRTRAGADAPGAATASADAGALRPGPPPRPPRPCASSRIGAAGKPRSVTNSTVPQIRAISLRPFEP